MEWGPDIVKGEFSQTEYYSVNKSTSILPKLSSSVLVRKIR